MLLKLSLKNPFSELKREIQVLLKSKSKLNVFFDLTILFLFSLLFFSIPAFSFSLSWTRYITWVLSILLFTAVVFSIVKFYSVRIDYIVVCLSFFCFLFFVSSAISLFLNFDLTYVLLTIFTIAIYMYCKANNKICSMLLNACYLGTLMFLLFFIVFYCRELLHPSSKRIGRFFGDENDIAIFNCLCASFSAYHLIRSKNVWNKSISFIIFVLSSYCAILSGSKIVILLIPISVFLLVFYSNGKKKWWISVLEVLGLIGLAIIVLNLPFAAELRHRFLSMINVFTSNQISGADSVDGSTTSRMLMFFDGIDLFLRRPLLGYGANGFANYGAITGGWSHNHISEMLCNTGLIGFLLFHVPFVKSIFGFFGNNRKDCTLLSFQILVFFAIASISIALPSEKMFSFIIGPVYSSLIKSSDLYCFHILRKGVSKNADCRNNKFVQE